MWSTVSDNLTTTIAAFTGLAALLGAWLKLRPRRLIGWLSAVKERETLLAMYLSMKEQFENEQEWGLYWKQQAQECVRQYQQDYQSDAIADQRSGLPAGGGRPSSGSGDGPIPMDRWTG